MSHERARSVVTRKELVTPPSSTAVHEHAPLHIAAGTALLDIPLYTYARPVDRRFLYTCSNNRRGRCDNAKKALESIVRTKLLAGFLARIGDR
jgi:hypothetical protein